MKESFATTSPQTRYRVHLAGLWLFLLLLTVTRVEAREHAESEKAALDRYLQSLGAGQSLNPGERTVGSLWVDQSPMATVANDAKARRVHDLITIAVAEQTLAQAAGDVTTQRDYSASSGISALGGLSTASISQLFSPASSSSLKGKGQANSNSTLRTTLSGEVVAVLPNGNMVVEARRSVKMNNELRTLVLRGVVRPLDVSPGNIVNSAAIASLQIELKGKGVVSDGTRPNNVGIRWLWKVLGF